jgi:hypothetical protein
MHTRSAVVSGCMVDACARTQRAAASAGVGLRAAFAGVALHALKVSTARPIRASVLDRRMRISCVRLTLQLSCGRVKEEANAQHSQIVRSPVCCSAR